MKQCFWKLMVPGLLLGGAVAAQAGTPVGSWSLGAGVIWTNTDADRQLDDHYGVDFEVGYALSEQWDVVFNAFSGKHDNLAAGATDTRKISGVTFDFDRIFNRGARVSPFLLFGVGVVDQQRGDIGRFGENQNKEVAGKLGVGVLADLGSWSGGKLQLKGDVLARGSVGRGIIDAVASLGLQVAFGGK